MAILDWFFGAVGFVPHGFCLAWRPDLVALHAGADLFTAGAYFAIPAAIATFVRKRSDLTPEHRRIAVLFALFIVACGLTHLVSLVTLWAPIYGVHGLIKAATAVVSVLTVCVVWPILPRLIALPSPADLAAANARLTDEITAKNDALAALEEARVGLEREVAARTRELAARAAELELANERFEGAIAGSNVTMFEQDGDLRYTWIANPIGLDAAQLVGRRDDEVLPADAAAPLLAAKRAVLASGEPLAIDHRLPAELGDRICRITLSRLGGAGGPSGLRAVVVDITEERALRERLQIVARELSHRAKNLLAVVSSLVAQIGRAEGAPASYLDSVTARLRALGRAHDALAAGQGRAVTVASLVDTQLAPLDVAGRVAVAGALDAEIAPEAAQMLALAIHELAANALKHGALSRPEGAVRLVWRVAEGRVALDWIERGGPQVVAPSRTGFGRKLLEAIVPGALRGQAALAYDPAGVRYALSYPLAGA